MGAFTGTFDNSVNNNNITTSATAGFNASGSGARTIKLGTATYTITNGAVTFTNITSLTYTGNTSANWVMTGATAGRLFTANSLSHGNLTFGAPSGSGSYETSGAATFASITCTAAKALRLAAGQTVTVSNSFTCAATVSAPIVIYSTLGSSAATLALPASQTLSGCGFRDMIFTGSPSATDSFDFGGNSGISITAPSTGGGTAPARVIGG